MAAADSLLREEDAFLLGEKVTFSTQFPVRDALNERNALTCVFSQCNDS